MAFIRTIRRYIAPGDPGALGVSRLLTGFVPLVKKAEVADDPIRAFLKDNSARAFSCRNEASS